MLIFHFQFKIIVTELWTQYIFRIVSYSIRSAAVLLKSAVCQGESCIVTCGCSRNVIFTYRCHFQMQKSNKRNFRGIMGAPADKIPVRGHDSRCIKCRDSLRSSCCPSPSSGSVYQFPGNVVWTLTLETSLASY